MPLHKGGNTLIAMPWGGSDAQVFKDTQSSTKAEDFVRQQVYRVRYNGVKFPAAVDESFADRLRWKEYGPLHA